MKNGTTRSTVGTHYLDLYTDHSNHHTTSK